MTRLRLAQLDQSAADVGEVVTWDGTVWAPSAPSPATFVRGVFTADPGDALIFLGGVPFTNSDAVYVDGLLLTPDVDYVLSGALITLTTPLSGGESVVVTFQVNGAAPVPSLTGTPTGFNRPTALARPVRRYRRIR